MEYETEGPSMGMIFPGATNYIDEDPDRDNAEAHVPLPEACPSLDMHMQVPRVQDGTITQSICSGASLRPLPEEHIGPRCFLPRTSFKLSNGGRITAAELRSEGGDIVMGPNGVLVRVLTTTRLPPVEQDIVHMFIEGNSYPFQVTSLHRIDVESSDGNFVAQAADVLRLQDVSVLSGDGYRRVARAQLARETTEVVDIKFELDARVLAWVLPKRPPRAGRPPLREEAAVCCLGARLSVDDNMALALSVSGTFLCAVDQSIHRNRGSHSCPDLLSLRE